MFIDLDIKFDVTQYNKTLCIKNPLTISYRNQNTKEPTCEKPFHNSALDGYEMPVKTQKDKEEGYEELPADRTGAVRPSTYDSYLEIIE